MEILWRKELAIYNFDLMKNFMYTNFNLIGLKFL